MQKIIDLSNTVFTGLQTLSQPIFLLFLRLWVAWVFFKAGLTKIDNWDSTLYLFNDEYKVPVLPGEIAAYLGTGVELIIPLVLAIGLFTRAFAGILFVFNIIAVISYPILIKDGFALLSLGALDHQIWGLMLLTTIIFGAGKISSDYLLKIK